MIFETNNIYTNKIMGKNVANSGGVSFVGLLTIAFVVLKLTKVIAWSWWWVLAPVWVPILLVFLWSIVSVIIIVIKHSK